MSIKYNHIGCVDHNYECDCVLDLEYTMKNGKSEHENRHRIHCPCTGGISSENDRISIKTGKKVMFIILHENGNTEWAIIKETDDYVILYSVSKSKSEITGQSKL